MNNDLNRYKIAGIVEASNFEVACILRELLAIVEYKDTIQREYSCTVTIGYIEKFQVVIHAIVYTINDKHILFWSPTSRVVDYNMIDNYFIKNFPSVHSTDAVNFRNVL